MWQGLRVLRWTLLLVLLTACAKPVEQTKKEVEKSAVSEEPEIVIPIEAEHPTRGDICAHFETTTRVIAENRVDVVPEGIGECMAVKVDEGDTVKKGDILAELKKDEALAALRQLEIQVAQQKTTYEIAEKSFAEGLGAEVERDNARFAYDQAKANLDAQRLKVDNLTIRAPISGVITRRNIQQGQMVSTGTPAFSLVDPTSYIVEINPPEKELTRLTLGQVASVSIDALENKEFPATLRRINPSVDPLTGTVKVVLDFDEDTRKDLRESAFARVRLVMETHKDALLLPKDTLVEENGRKYVFIVEEQPEEKPEEKTEEKTGDAAEEKSGQDESAETAPETAAKTEPDAKTSTEPATETPDDESKAVSDEADKEKEDAKETGPKLVANRVEVQTGLEDSNFVEILKGIDDNALVVTLGQHTLKPASRVRVTNAQTEIDAKADLSVKDALDAAKKEREKTEQAAKDKKRQGKKK